VILEEDDLDLFKPPTSAVCARVRNIPSRYAPTVSSRLLTLAEVGLGIHGGGFIAGLTARLIGTDQEDQRQFGCTRRCTNSGCLPGSFVEADGAQVGGRGAQGSAPALAQRPGSFGADEAQGRRSAAVYVAVHQLWLSARIVQGLTMMTGAAEDKTDQSIEKVFFLFGCLCDDGGERLRHFPPWGGGERGFDEGQVNIANRTRNQTTKRFKIGGSTRGSGGFGDNESGATADSRTDQVRRQWGS
jgi:hypothetical protein